MDHNDPQEILIKILLEYAEGTMEYELRESPQKVIHFFMSLVPLYTLLESNEFLKWNEIFQLKFPNEEE